MKVVLLVVAVLAAGMCGGRSQQLRLAPPDRSYKILFVLPGPFKSHEMLITPLITALADRGHQVSVLGGTSVDFHPNITRYYYNFSYEEYFSYPFYKLVEDPTKIVGMAQYFSQQAAQGAFESADVMRIYRNKKEFDIIVMDHLAFMSTYPLVHETNFALYCTTALNPVQSAVLGNIQSPAYLSSSIEDYPRPFSTIHRFKNLFATLVFAYVWRIALRSAAEKELSRRFPHLPSSWELESNASLTFINTHFAVDGTSALLPNQIMVAGMLTRPGRPLPRDLNTYMGGNGDAIFVSFGTFVPSSAMPEAYRKILFSVFKTLPYKIVFKYEGTTQEEQSHDNILVQNWLPQQDILAHPKTMLFINHCGLNGVHEAIYHAVPMICLPIMGDQVKMADTVHHDGIGIGLKWNQLTEQLLNSSILEVLTDPGYQRRISVKSAIFRDQRDSPLERAVYWTEYALRHGGAKHLQSPAKDLSWAEILYLDLLLYIFIFIYIAFRIFIPKLRSLCMVICSNLLRVMAPVEKDPPSKKTN